MLLREGECDADGVIEINRIRYHCRDVVGMSGFLTLAFDQMRATVGAIEEAGLRDSVKIMIGGSVLDESAAEYVGADAYGRDAMDAVKLAKTWTGGE